MLNQRPATFVYIDGFNLYHRKLRSTPFKWLNVRQFCEFMLPQNDVREIFYFTARILPRPNDPDLELTIRTCCQELKHPVGVLSTQTSNSLARKSGATFYKSIRDGVLRVSQFQPLLADADGEIHKPPTW